MGTVVHMPSNRCKNEFHDPCEVTGRCIAAQVDLARRSQCLYCAMRFQARLQQHSDEFFRQRGADDSCEQKTCKTQLFSPLCQCDLSGATIRVMPPTIRSIRRGRYQ